MQISGIAAASVALFLSGVLASAQPAPDPASATTLRLTNVVLALPVGAPWLSAKTGLLCIASLETLTWAGGRESQQVSPYEVPFKAQMEGAGYRVVTPEDNLFDHEGGAADYQVAAIITDAHIDACVSQGNLFQERGSVRGSATMKVDWQIYSPIRKQMVARLSSSASTTLANSIPGGAQKLIVEAFNANVRELVSNTEFHASTSGAKPLASNSVLLPGKQDKITLAGSLKAAKRPVSDAVGSIVTILTGSGSGSGDLVSNDGYMLTNAHVVGDEKSVRVRWSDGIETVAEVIRVAKDRDIALIKTNPRDREPLAIKRGALTPGTRVYAIGSPLGKAYQGTVSSGVVSATRTVEGLRYIQSDVSITHGSSGGALLDENGAVIGIAVSGVEVGGPVGINFFIPIGDAMDFLNLEPN
ncbi:MAG: trypsin-like peptidase domain-containing protein [Alphaproteobacteria bacterium]